MSDSPSKGHPLHLSISQSSSGSLSCPSRDGGPPPFPNTPSKHKSSVFAGSKQYYYSQRAVNKFWRNTRWILLGFGIGAATTALFHAVNIPTIRVELEYADAPGMLETSTTVLNKAAKAAHLSAPVSLHTKEQQPPKQQETKYRQKGDQEMDNLAETDDQVDNDEGETKAEREEDVEQVGLANDEEGDINDDTNPGSLRSQNDASQRSKDAALKFQLPKIGTSTDANNTAIKSAPKTQTQIYPLPGDPVFDNVPPPPTLDENEDFAACLLIKDDNHWLVEWLAYHYHVMPMRDLIVAVDPESKTSPMRIINRWRDSGLMRIDVWNDTQFMPKQIKGNLRLYDNNTELMVHRTRQNNFYFKCINKFRNRKKEWLMLVDTDEYIVTNYASGLYFNITKNIPISKPGNVLTFIKQHHQLTRENHTCLYVSTNDLGNGVVRVAQFTETYQELLGFIICFIHRNHVSCLESRNKHRMKLLIDTCHRVQDSMDMIF